MGLETGTYINSLVATNPVGATDPKSQGDDHLRLIKATLLATFANITGAVTASHTELSYVTGVTSAIQTQLGLKAALLSPTFTGTPAAPTAMAGTSTTQIATTEFVLNAVSSGGGLLGPAGGGTGVANNAAATLTRSGNYDLTLTLSAASSLTVPTTGTLATRAGAEALTNKTISGASNTLTVRLANDVSGTLPVANGGTGITAPSTVGNVLTSDGAGAWVSSAPSAGALSALLAASGANTISNGDNAQSWRWALSAAAKSAFKFTESAASTNGVSAQFLVDIQTVALSTAIPLRATARGTSNGITMSAGGDVNIGQAATPAFTWSASTNQLRLQGQGGSVIGFYNTDVANDTTACVMTATAGPVGANTAIQGWLKLDVGGANRYVPFW